MSKNNFSTWQDVVITSVVGYGIFLLSIILVVGINLYHRFGFLENLFLFWICVQVFAVCGVRVINKVYPLPDGIYHIKTSPSEWHSWKLRGVLLAFHLRVLYETQLVPMMLKKFLYRLLGAKIARGIIPIDGYLGDPHLTELEENTIIGSGALILGHAILSQNLLLIGKVTIKKGAIIGAYAVVNAGCTIGENAVVNAGAVVPSGTTIGNDEIWGGNPAKKIGTVLACQDV